MHTVANPFELMMNPEAVFAALEKSDRLTHLHRRVYHPLDKPAPRAEGRSTHVDDAPDDDSDA